MTTLSFSGTSVVSATFIFILIFSVWIKIDQLNEQITVNKDNCYLEGTDFGALMQEQYVKGAMDILAGNFTKWCQAHIIYGARDEVRNQNPDLYDQLCPE